MSDERRRFIRELREAENTLASVRMGMDNDDDTLTTADIPAFCESLAETFRRTAERLKAVAQ